MTRYEVGDYVVFAPCPRRLWRVVDPSERRNNLTVVHVRAVCNLDGTPALRPYSLHTDPEQLASPNAMCLLALIQAGHA